MGYSFVITTSSMVNAHMSIGREYGKGWDDRRFPGISRRDVST